MPSHFTSIYLDKNGREILDEVKNFQVLIGIE